MEYNFKGIPSGPDSGIYALLRQAGQTQRLGKSGRFETAFSGFLLQFHKQKII